MRDRIIEFKILNRWSYFDRRYLILRRNLIDIEMNECVELL